MRKIISSLFFILSFASAEFSVILTDEKNQNQVAVDNGNLNLDILSSDKQYYDFSASNILTGSYFFFTNVSNSNILVRFSSLEKTKNQVIFEVGTEDTLLNGDYYALSLCQIDKGSINKPRKSFFILNKGERKIVMFYLRNCETGKLDPIEPVDLKKTELLISQTQVNDIDIKSSNTSNLDYGIPTVIIGKTSTRELNDCALVGNTVELYDGNDKKIADLNTNIRSLASYLSGNNSHTISFTIENKPGTNYRKMYLKATCDINNKREYKIYFFDARPKEIRVKNLPSKDMWLYAEYKYKSDGSSYYDEFSNAIANYSGYKNSTMQALQLIPVDANGVEIKDYHSVSEIAIMGKIYGDGNDKTINELNSNTLIRSCYTGSRSGCAIAVAEITGDTKSEIYTNVDNNTKIFTYNNVGPTVLYGVDTEWTKYSQSYTRGAKFIGYGLPQASVLCEKFESYSNEKSIEINTGKSVSMVGCNIPFVADDGSDELHFYTFKPAVYNLVLNGKNSAANESYGTDKLTYMRTISESDFEFEAADFKASVLAIGASLESLENERTLSHYDNHLKVADKLKFSGNPTNPIIKLEGASKQNDIAEDFEIIISDSDANLDGALIVSLEPKDPYDHEKGYKNTATLTKNQNKEELTINRNKDNFYAGKNIKDNKLNFLREYLLARNYVHLSQANLNVNKEKNQQLLEKIKNNKAAFVFSYKGDDLNFVDTAIIAPNVASNETSADAAVYLAGYCEPTSRTNCTKKDVFVSNTITGHMSYFGFDFLVYGEHDPDIKESSTDGLFEYGGATFAQFKNGADFLSSFETNEANEVTIMLKGDQAEDYCKIFRNCYKLENGKFGTTFNSYKASITQWYGSGDKQGKTIVDNIAKDGKNTRRKEQRLSF